MWYVAEDTIFKGLIQFSFPFEVTSANAQVSNSGDILSPDLALVYECWERSQRHSSKLLDMPIRSSSKRSSLEASTGRYPKPLRLYCRSKRSEWRVIVGCILRWFDCLAVIYGRLTAAHWWIDIASGCPDDGFHDGFVIFWGNRQDLAFSDSIM